jgi:hypothetical protein
MGIAVTARTSVVSRTDQTKTPGQPLRIEGVQTGPRTAEYELSNMGAHTAKPAFANLQLTGNSPTRTLSSKVFDDVRDDCLEFGACSPESAGLTQGCDGI